MKRWLSAFCFRISRGSPRTQIQSPNKESSEPVADEQSSNRSTHDPKADPQSRIPNTEGFKKTEMAVSSQVNPMNIVLNPDFSDGLHSWRSNCCDIYVVSGETGLLDGVAANSGGSYAVVTKRSECWQGLEQDITDRVILDTTYTVSACVRVSGDILGSSGVQATLKLENQDSSTSYVFVGRVLVSKERWEKLEGTFSLTSMPKRVIFYLEGPSPGVDLLIDSVTISSSNPMHSERVIIASSVMKGDENIIWNPCFEDGLNNWSGRGCKLVRHNSLGDGRILPMNGNFFAAATSRNQSWNGIQQDITDRVQRKIAYEVTAVVRIIGNSSSDEVRATLWVQAHNGREHYIGIAKMQASEKEWGQLCGKFLLNGHVAKAVIYLEGPSSGNDILVDSLVVNRAKKLKCSTSPDTKGLTESKVHARSILNTNIILNHDFTEGLHCWSLNCCDGYVVSGESEAFKGVIAKTGIAYAVITNRTQGWQGLEQDITAKTSYGSTYIISAYVRICGAHEEPVTVNATLRLEYSDSPTSYLPVGSALVSKERWEKVEGSFSLEKIPKRVVFYLEGPSPGIDLLIDSVIISESGPKRLVQHALHGVNIIENSNLHDGLNYWIPLGSCALRICTGSPSLLPSVANNSLGTHNPLSGHYILATNRTETWMGPSQTITDKLRLHVTYQIAAWVRVGSRASWPQDINVALGVDDQWVNGGQVRVSDDEWHEVRGSFRIEKQPSKVIVYLQGPLPGVDLMLAGLHIFPVNRKARFKHLVEKTNKVRKRDVVLKFQGIDGGNSYGVSVRVRQVKNSFPFGSCLNRSNIDNEEFTDFFVNNFNWAVFGNELKWYHTESQRGKYNYEDANEMLDFCQRHGIETRGHCIFWEVEDVIQPWVRSLNSHDLMAAVQNRLTGLLSRYKGKFRHYDVNNEMLHGSFYRDRLGEGIRSYMFEEAHRLDPTAVLFVNDYNVEDGRDGKSSPEMYIRQILDLQERGAPIGGVGLQGHIDHPVGEIISDALDKLSILGLPIWLTEVDVAAVDEHVRADDLEVVLREAYAHPAVEGVILWGFWELFMCRDNSHLVDAEGSVNEAGKRFLELKREWLSEAEGVVDADGEFRFRGYQGAYTVEITTPLKRSSQSFVVEGESPLMLSINL